jgi:hypothetical protein
MELPEVLVGLPLVARQAHDLAVLVRVSAAVPEGLDVV